MSTAKPKQPADESPAAEEAAGAPALSGLGKQLVMLPVLWLSNKVDWTQSAAQSAMLALFGLVVASGFLLIQLTLRKIYKARDTGRVSDPGDGPFLTPKEEDGTMSVQDYDVAKVKELKMQFMCSVVIVTFLHVKWGYTQPILVMSLMQPMNFWALQVFHIHLRGVKAEGHYARPWSKPDAGPLMKWAERMKKEEDAKAATAIKQD